MIQEKNGNWWNSTQDTILKPGNGLAEFRKFFDSVQAVLDTGTSYDLYLLDVLMPGKSGIQGAADLLNYIRIQSLYLSPLPWNLCDITGLCFWFSVKTGSMGETSKERPWTGLPALKVFSPGCCLSVDKVNRVTR